MVIVVSRRAGQYLGSNVISIVPSKFHSIHSSIQNLGDANENWLEVSVGTKICFDQALGTFGMPIFFINA